MASSFRGTSRFQVTRSFLISDRYGGTEGSICRGFVDTNGNGDNDFVFNIDMQPEFAALAPDGSELWHVTHRTSTGKSAYYPKFTVDETAIIYGDRGDDTVYCVELSDGSLRWTYTASGNIQATEVLDGGGVAVGSDGSNGEVVLLNESDGSVKSGWPVSIKQHEQCLAAGDIDADGNDELVCNNNSGLIDVRNQDGSQVFSISSNHTHADFHQIGNIDPNSNGHELLTTVDDDDSSSGEGDEIVTYNTNGTEVSKYTAQSGVNISVGDIQSDRNGLEVFWDIEGGDRIGLLDGSLNELWTRDIPPKITGPSGGGGQTALADFDGDGEVECWNVTGQGAAEGILGHTPTGEYVGRLKGLGWDFDPQLRMPTGQAGSKRFADVDGDGKEEIYMSKLGTKTFEYSNEEIHIIQSGY